MVCYETNTIHYKALIKGVASYLIFVFPWLRLGLCSSSDGHYSISSSFIPSVYCDYFSTIPISVYAFSLFISGFVLTSQPFFASSPFSCGEPAHSFVIQFSVMLEPGRSLPLNFIYGIFTYFLVHNLFENALPLHCYILLHQIHFATTLRFLLLYIQARFEDTFLPLV